MPKKLETDLTFESAMSELEEVTQRLENGKDTLDESICLYERGMLLKVFCEKQLKAAESKWTVLRKNKNDSIDEVELMEEERQNLAPNQTQINSADLF